GDLENAKKCLLEAKKDCKHFIGEKNVVASHIYHNLAAVYTDMGQFSLAEKNYLKAMEIRKTVMGEQNSLLAITYLNLAAIYARKETLVDLMQAYNYAKKSLDIRIKIYGIWHDETAESYDALAKICYTTGQFDLAREYTQSVQKIYIKLYGKNSKKVIDNEYNMKLLQQTSVKK
ncbi:MAG: tetratricopeptide repeat protein, partial [Lachnospiraceae bacterium]|nr:tetratricopeptide repeat protein [Lachnospiraceae bacterium]